MHLPADDLQVSYKQGSSVRVRIIMGKGKDAVAVITTNWRSVVRKSNMKNMDIMQMIVLAVVTSHKVI